MKQGQGQAGRVRSGRLQGSARLQGAPGRPLRRRCSTPVPLAKEAVQAFGAMRGALLDADGAEYPGRVLGALAKAEDGIRLTRQVFEEGAAAGAVAVPLAEATRDTLVLALTLFFEILPSVFDATSCPAGVRLAELAAVLRVPIQPEGPAVA